MQPQHKLPHSSMASCCSHCCHERSMSHLTREVHLAGLMDSINQPAVYTLCMPPACAIRGVACKHKWQLCWLPCSSDSRSNGTSNGTPTGAPTGTPTGAFYWRTFTEVHAKSVAASLQFQTYWHSLLAHSTGAHSQNFMQSHFLHHCNFRPTGALYWHTLLAHPTYAAGQRVFDSAASARPSSSKTVPVISIGWLVAWGCLGSPSST